MSDYLENNPSEVKNAAYYRKQMKELERENTELKQQITLLSGVFSREEELQAHITELKRIIAESKDYIKIAHLIGSIFCHGNFTAETYNERELEKLLIKVGRFYQSTDEVVEAAKSIIE